MPFYYGCVECDVYVMYRCCVSMTQKHSSMSIASDHRAHASTAAALGMLTDGVLMMKVLLVDRDWVAVGLVVVGSLYLNTMYKYARIASCEG